MTKKKLVEPTDEDIKTWTKIPKNKFFRLALAQLCRENHPWVHYTGTNEEGRAVYDIDEDHPEYSFKKMWLAIFTTMHKVVRAYQRNHARIEVKLYDRIS